MSTEKLDFLERSKTFWNPGKTQAWQDMGIDLVIDRREGYYLYDMDGARLIDVHLNGGTYNIGHRHPELVEVLNQATRRFDMGNHHFPSLARTALAEMLAACTPGEPAIHHLWLGRGRGHRHRHQDGAQCHAEAQDRLHRQSLSRPYRSGGQGGRGTLFGALPVGRHRRGIRAGAVQRPQRHGGRAQEARRRRRPHGDHPGHLRLSHAAGGLSAGGKEAVRAL